MPLSQADLRAARLRSLEGGATAEPAAEEVAPPPAVTAVVSAAAAAPTNDSLGDATVLTEAEIASVRRLLWALDAPEDDRRRWHRQGFVFCSPGEGPSFGLQQVRRRECRLSRPVSLSPSLLWIFCHAKSVGWWPMFVFSPCTLILSSPPSSHPHPSLKRNRVMAVLAEYLLRCKRSCFGA